MKLMLIALRQRLSDYYNAIYSFMEFQTEMKKINFGWIYGL